VPGARPVAASAVARSRIDRGPIARARLDIDASAARATPRCAALKAVRFAPGLTLASSASSACRSWGRSNDVARGVARYITPSEYEAGALDLDRRSAVEARGRDRRPVGALPNQMELGDVRGRDLGSAKKSGCWLRPPPTVGQFMPAPPVRSRSRVRLKLFGSTTAAAGGGAAATVTRKRIAVPTALRSDRVTITAQRSAIRGRLRHPGARPSRLAVSRISANDAPSTGAVRASR